MEYDLTTRWTGEGIAFTSDVEGFEINMDSSAQGSGLGPGPKRLLLLSVMGCTGLDVVSLMQKMRVPFTGFSIRGVAPLTEEHPKVFTKIHLIYSVTGKDIKRDKVVKAIELSQSTYCGVSIMLKKHCPVTWDLEIIDA